MFPITFIHHFANIFFRNIFNIPHVDIDKSNCKSDDHNYYSLDYIIQAALRDRYGDPALTLYHLSISPALFTDTAQNLNQSGITDMKGQHRLIIEKPFGNDLASSEQLNQELNNYYDEYGAFLDMFQNHLLQLMAVTGIDLPEEPTEEEFHKAKVNFFKAIPDFTQDEVENYTVRGQYRADEEGEFNNYRDEVDVDPNSSTDSFIAGRVMIDNERWKGVPFYYRTGKALDETLSTITLVLKTDYDIPEGENLITFYIRPNDGIKITLNQKDLGPHFKPETVKLESYRHPEDYEATEYEKLIYDVIEGNQMFFTTWEEVREQWRITDSIRKAWKELPEPEMPNYTAGTQGPEAALKMLEQDGHYWVD